MSIAITISSDKTPAGVETMLCRVELDGHRNEALEFDGFNDLTFTYPKKFNRGKGLPVTYSSNDGKKLTIVNNEGEKVDAYFMAHYTEMGSIRYQEKIVSPTEKKEVLQSIRNRYSSQQSTDSYSHEKQVRCADLVDKFVETCGKTKLKVLYIGPDDLLNLKTVIMSLKKVIKPDYISLDLSTTPVDKTEYGDSQSFENDEILGVKINRRIPHGSDELPQDYDLIIDCYTYPVWPKEQRVSIFQKWKEILNKRGSLVFVTPDDLTGDIYFDKKTMLDHEKDMRNAYGDYTSQTVVKVQDNNIYSILLNFGKDSVGREHSNDIAQNILKYKPLIGQFGRFQFIDAETLPKLKSSKGKVSKLQEVLEDENDIVLIHGPGGIGKSTFAKWAASLSIKEGERFPIMINGDQLKSVKDKNKQELLKISFDNLCKHDAETYFEHYQNDEIMEKEVLLLLDQLDDIEQDEYEADIAKIIDSEIPRLLETHNIKAIMFAREDIKFENASSYHITTDIDEIKILLSAHSMEINDYVEKQLEEINRQEHALVRADVPYLLEFLKEDCLFDDYGFFKSKYIPKMMYQEHEIKTRRADEIIKTIIAYLFTQENPKSVDELSEVLVKSGVVSENGNEDLKTILVASRLFDEVSEKWRISCHDTIRDSFAVNFYDDKERIKKFCSQNLHHPLSSSRLDNYSNKSLNRRIISKIIQSQDYVKILSIMTTICGKSSHKMKIHYFNNYLSQEQEYNLGLESSHKFGDDDLLFDIGNGLWEFFGYSSDNEKDKDSFIRIMKQNCCEVVLEKFDSAYDSGTQNCTIHNLLRRYEITPKQFANARKQSE